MTSEQKIIADKLREILVDSLRLPMKPEDIGYETELFGEGLGIDSVDILELVVGIEAEFGLQMTVEHRPYFKNLETLSSFILENRK